MFRRFVWSPNERHLCFEGEASNATNVWRVPVDPDTLAWRGLPERLTTSTPVRSSRSSIAPAGAGLRLFLRDDHNPATQKLFGYPPVQSYVGFPNFSLIGIAGMLETFGGVLLLVGLFTHPVAFILAGEMAVAYFRAHWPCGPFPILNSGELSALYCFLFLYFVADGPGPWSLDHVFRRRTRA